MQRQLLTQDRCLFIDFEEKKRNVIEEQDLPLLLNHINNSIKKNPEINAVLLAHMDVSRFSNDALNAFISQLPKAVTTLRFSRCTLTVDALANSLGPALESNKQITACELFASLTEENALAVAQLLEAKQLKAFSLHLNKKPKPLAILVHALATAGNDHLKKLLFSSCILDGQAITAIATLLGAAHCKLDSLALRHCGLTPSLLTILANALHANANTLVTHLDFSNNGHTERFKSNAFDDESLNILGTILENNPIESLILQNCGLDASRLQKLVAQLERNQQIRVLDLSGNKFDFRARESAEQKGEETASESFATYLQKHPILQSLNLSNCGLHSNTMALLFEALEHTSIYNLNISNNPGLSPGLPAIAQFLRNTRTLTHLDLSKCNLIPQALALLITALGENHTLTSLNLADNNPDDNNISALLDMLKKNPQINSLDLRNCELSLTSLRNIAKFLEENTTLSTLKLSWNYMQTEDLAQLREVLTAFKNAVNSNNNITNLKIFSQTMSDALRRLPGTFGVESENLDEINEKLKQNRIRRRIRDVASPYIAAARLGKADAIAAALPGIMQYTASTHTSAGAPVQTQALRQTGLFHKEVNLLAMFQHFQKRVQPQLENLRQHMLETLSSKGQRTSPSVSALINASFDALLKAQSPKDYQAALSHFRNNLTTMKQKKQISAELGEQLSTMFEEGMTGSAKPSPRPDQ